ncbi:uncharacterized protein LOC124372712 [Homalodisca vitripennis]|uniref:uncharacterized protein LOC124372712 n=1 Tax=Homalodisca vitripennis TaxID=197043 RepID=UPI001EEC65F8|nr:uncharacterized protein LOC124372712 [Homalodisca vitripennis]
MLKNFLIPEIRINRFNRHRIWFQQDGATAHTANVVINSLRRKFRGRVISRFGDIAWPPRSPDLSICDFFLWGLLKSRVYTNKPRTLYELKETIRQEIANLSPEMLGEMFDNFSTRLEECIAKNGHHLKDVIFKS